MIFLFGGGKKSCDFVISKYLFDQVRDSNRLYSLREALSPKSDKTICSVFDTHVSFIVDMPLSEKDKEAARKLATQLGIQPIQAEELILAKKTGAKLVLAQQQLWFDQTARKAGVRTKSFR